MHNRAWFIKLAWFGVASSLAASLAAAPLTRELAWNGSPDLDLEWNPDAASLLEWNSDSRSAWSVSLHGGASQSSDGRAAAFGLLSLSLDLERLAAGSVALPPDSDTALAEPGDAPEANPAAPRAPLRTPAPGQQLSPSLARGAIKAALLLLGAEESRRRFEGMAARSRARAALPELGLRAGSSRDESLRLAPVAADPARVTQSGGRDLWFEARLTWRLDRALFSPDEVAIERLKWNGEQAKERLVRRVLDSLFAWQDAELRLSDPLQSGAQYREAWLAALRAAAELDVLTDGWFSRQIGDP